MEARLTRLQAAPAVALRVVLGIVGILPTIAWILHAMGKPWPLLEAWFSLQCHRDWERSFALGGTAYVVCVRCAGVYLGLFFGAGVPRTRMRAFATRGGLYVTAFAMAGTWAAEKFALMSIPASARFFVGLTFGAAVAGRLRTLAWELLASDRAAGAERIEPLGENVER